MFPTKVHSYFLVPNQKNDNARCQNDIMLLGYQSNIYNLVKNYCYRRISECDYVTVVRNFRDRVKRRWRSKTLYFSLCSVKY